MLFLGGLKIPLLCFILVGGPPQNQNPLSAACRMMDDLASHPLHELFLIPVNALIEFKLDFF